MSTEPSRTISRRGPVERPAQSTTPAGGPRASASASTQKALDKIKKVMRHLTNTNHTVDENFDRGQTHTTTSPELMVLRGLRVEGDAHGSERPTFDQPSPKPYIMHSSAVRGTKRTNIGRLVCFSTISDVSVTSLTAVASHISSTGP